MSKVKRLANKRLKPAVIDAHEFHLLLQQSQVIKKMEKELDAMKEEHSRAEQVILEQLDKGLRPDPDAPIPLFYVEKSFRKNIKWRQLFEEHMGVKVALHEYDKWPSSEYRHVRFGKPPAKTKQYTEIVTY